MGLKWKTLTGSQIPDIIQWVKNETRDGQIIHIGTDSLQTGRWTQFVTVVVILNPPKGGRVAYSREIMPRIESLRERLNKEVWKSVDLAMNMPETPELTVHIDANTDKRFKSSKYVEEFVGLVVGQGFKALWKPDSWAATHAADHVVRLKNVERGRERLAGGNRRGRGMHPHSKSE